MFNLISIISNPFEKVDLAKMAHSFDVVINFVDTFVFTAADIYGILMVSKESGIISLIECVHSTYIVLIP